MTTMVLEIYDALRKAGVDEATARRAATAVLGSDVKEELVTKEFLRAEVAGLRAEMSDLRSEIIKWNVGAMAVLTAIFAAIVRWQ